MELNNHWINIPLEDLTVHVIGGDWGKESDFIEDGYEAVACIRGSEFKHWKIDFGRTAVIRKIKIPSIKTRELLKGDILVEISGGGPEQPVGRTVLISDTVLKQHNLPIVCTNFIRMMRLAPCINSVFVNRYLELFYLSGEVIKYQGGSNNLRNLKFKDYSKINIPLPSYAEQKIIADKLDDLLARVESIKTRLENIPEILKKFRQSVLSAAVSGELTEERAPWQEVLLKDACTAIVDCPHSTPKWSPSGKYCVRTTAFKPFELDLSEQGFVDEEIYKNRIKRLKPIEEDILYSREGTVGIACQIPKGVELCLGQRMVLIRANDKILSKYLTIVLNSNKILDIVNFKIMGSTAPRINLSDIRVFPIPLPSILEQEEIILHIEQAFNYGNNIESKIKKLLSLINNLTQSILAKAFRGELTAQWREENPELISGLNSAEALLEKITAEKLATGTIKKRAKKTSH